MLPSLRGFGLFLCVAFVNAFIDLGHKILIQNTLFKIYDDSTQVGLTALVNGLILLPFILLFLPAGFLADRYAKPRIMQWTAVGAIGITLVITLAYYQGWFWTAFAMTFLLAAQSALYSPAKYGYLREMGGVARLPALNGFLQAVTIVAILSGIVVFSVLFEGQLQGVAFQSEAEILRTIAPLGWVLVALAVVQWRLTLRLSDYRDRSAARRSWQHYRATENTWRTLRALLQQPVIGLSILALSLFWGLSQTVLAVFPAFAKQVLAEDNTIVIQGLLACAGIGIIFGSLLAGRLGTAFQRPLIVLGALGLCASLFTLPHLDTISGFASVIIAFGFAGGCLIIPLNALLQATARAEDLGTVLAGNNWVLNAVMLSFLVLTYLAAHFAFSSHALLLSLPWLAMGFFALLAHRARRRPIAE